MLKKIFIVFSRDLKVNLRNFLTIYLMLAPFLLAIGINVLVPSVNDTTVNLVMLEDSDIEFVESMEQFAKVQLVADEDALIERIEKRDNTVAILPDGDSYYILQQGNEPDSVVDFTKILKSFVELDYRVEESNVTMIDFGRTEPPLKKMLVNLFIIFMPILGGMLIAMNIVEEKVDNTVSAMNVTPISRLGFILGKSMIGMIVSIYATVILLWLTGYRDINYWMVLIQMIAISVLSILFGFVQGINSDDVMDAAAGLKMMFLPVVGAVAGSEFLAEKWQWICYWLPFYWSYRGNDAIMAKVATWPQILLYTLFSFMISAVAFALLAPRIRKGLE